MQDLPRATQLLRAVIAFLEDAAIPRLSGREAFDAKVAARALGIVEREIDLGPGAAFRELTGLRDLLGQDGTLEDLNRLLCERIQEGLFDLGTPGLADHLWAVTLDKLSIDQPTYSSYRAYLEARGQHDTENRE